MQGPPGESLVHYDITPPNPAVFNLNIITNVPSAPADSGEPLAGSVEGVALFDPFFLDAGTYLISSTAQFFDFNNNTTTGPEFGVTKTWLCTSDTSLADCRVPSITTTWTPDIPDDANNAAQQSGSIVVNVPADGRWVVSRSVVRGGTGTYQAGANVIVTRLGP